MRHCPCAHIKAKRTVKKALADCRLHNSRYSDPFFCGKIVVGPGRLTQLSAGLTHYQVTAEIEFVKSTLLKVSTKPFKVHLLFYHVKGIVQ
jgi:hypothetical protein